ncbi:AAA family ATPase [Nocardia sp. SC052]|uniref:AAA family ATPase n=1 Tax=Nocardia sichangensis TaxID=3385975 RepID=UPI0039A0A698
MQVMGPTDRLRSQPSRITVAGSSGSGKTQLARALGKLLDLPYVELDSLYHGPGWTVRDSWVRDVIEFTSGPKWVIEWQGDPVREHLARNADVLIWLDHSRALCTYRVVKRTVLGRISGRELWNGNTERPLREVFTDPEHIIRFAWRIHPAVRRKVTALIAELSYPDLQIVRLRGQRQVDVWLDGPLRRAMDRGGQ